MRTLSDWLAWMETLHPREIELGLVRVNEVRDRLGLAQPTFAIITVAGTNGKGSTVAMLEHVLHAAGYRVGAYTSPHLIDYNERVRIATETVSDAELCAAFERVEAVRADTPLTYFEFGTLAAMDHFRQREVDIVILEVGLGGRLDAVNAWDADVAIVSSIGIDHTEWLGPDRESIGREKAGVYRAQRCAICGDPDPPRSLIEVAEQVGARLLCVNRDFDFERLPEGWTWRALDKKHSGLPYPAMRGDYQLYNAACVIMALSCLVSRFPVKMADIRAGLLNAVLPGRFQTLPGRPVRVLDVAHNAQAARALAQTLHEQIVPGRTIAVCGMLHDKPIVDVLRILMPQVSSWHVAGLPGTRGTSTEDMRAALAAAGVSAGAGLHEDIEQAYAAALAEANEHDRIVAFGSFYTVGAILRQPKNRTGVMAERKETEDDFNPRHRIVGAVVLVALAVIFLPMLLSDRPPDSDDSKNVSGGPAPETRIVVTPVPPPGDKAPGFSKSAVSEKAPEKAGAAAKTVVVPVEQTTEIPALAKAPTIPESPQPDAQSALEPNSVSEAVEPAITAKPTTPVGKGWLVQVGAFSQLENAKRLHDKLSQKGYTAKLDPPNPVKGKTVRVEVGPYKDAAAAKAAQARILSEFGIKGVVRKQ
jgi:dihydrofolate synthase/folylpolyglutamate synthase